MNKKDLTYIAKSEEIPVSILKEYIDKGETVIVKNRYRNIKPLGIGKGLKVKVNTNLGASTKRPEIKDEIAKLKASIQAGTDTVMDLTVGKNIRKIRKRILEESTVPVGTVPIYQAAHKAEEKYGSFERITPDDILSLIEEQAQEGVDFFTLHSGIKKAILDSGNLKDRQGGIVSRGGALISRWIQVNKKENPLYEYFDDILKILKKYGVTLSLGDGLRPGAIADSLDYFQIQELLTLGELKKRAAKQNVPVIIEGPGHVPLDQIQANVVLQKQLCGNAPFYILGPLVTDIASGFDHISSAIGGALACLYGADFICVVTPKEHIGHPNIDDIKQGIVAARIAAHAVDIVRNPKLRRKDTKISIARKNRNWKEHINLSIYPEQIRKLAEKRHLSEVCSMCGKYCSLEIMEKP
jgi:phosphomethylpyrimidine synthase